MTNRADKGKAIYIVRIIGIGINNCSGMEEIYKMTANLKPQLELERCPHCNVDHPSLMRQWGTQTHSHDKSNIRQWSVYLCVRCGGLVTAAAQQEGYAVRECYPPAEQIDESLPPTAHAYLSQAIQSRHAPAGAVMLAASSVDAMLKSKGYKEGSLHARINQAAKDHLITEDMAKWAHQVRLDANDQRHADEKVALPTGTDAARSIHFAEALGTFLFILPGLVTRGLQESGENGKK